jgi:hypothetical protein
MKLSQLHPLTILKTCLLKIHLKSILQIPSRSLSIFSRDISIKIVRVSLIHLVQCCAQYEQTEVATAKNIQMQTLVWH